MGRRYLKEWLLRWSFTLKTLEHFRFGFVHDHVKIKSYMVTALLGNVPFNVKCASFGLQICETH